MRWLRLPWWLAVFLLALAARLAFLFGADEPLLYSHQYHYFTGALSITEHPVPLRFVLESDDWHVWGGHWTLPPLYHLFLASVFGLLGPHLLAVQLLQCILDAAAAVMVGHLGRRVGRHGAWAGAAYALYLPAVVLPSSTISENLHTPLLVGAMATLTSAGPGLRRTVVAGLLLGFSGLARTVSLAFAPLAALWRWRVQREGRAGRAALLLVASTVAPVLPWTARNVLVIGDPLPVDSVSVFNLWTDNAFVSPERYERQAYGISREPTPAARRAAAIEFAWLGITRNPGAFLGKVVVNFQHFFRPEGLHQLLAAEFPHPAWRHLATLVLDDALLIGAVVLWLLYAVAGPPSPARRLLVLWAAYYLLMVVVVFHNEIRYRSAFVPFLFAGAVGGVAVLRSADDRRGRRFWLAVATAAGLVLTMVRPYVETAWRAARAAWALAPAEADLRRGDLEAARTAVLEAARRDWYAARPWLVFGRLLLRHDHPAEALEAYRRADMRKAEHWVTRLALPRALAGAGQPEEAAVALARANEHSASADPWLALEIAWRELPAPRADEILLSRGDYGAVRGFLHPRGDHRWSRHRAWLRLTPTTGAGAYDVTVEMGSPPPSPRESPEVTLQGPGGEADFRLTRDVRPYTLRVRPAAGQPIVVELTTPTWCRAGEPAEQGVRVDRVTVTPVR